MPWEVVPVFLQNFFMLSSYADFRYRRRVSGRMARWTDRGPPRAHKAGRDLQVKFRQKAGAEQRYFPVAVFNQLFRCDKGAQLAVRIDSDMPAGLGMRIHKHIGGFPARRNSAIAAQAYPEEDHAVRIAARDTGGKVPALRKLLGNSEIITLYHAPYRAAARL